MGKKLERCVICGDLIVGYGNNPWPVKESGRCCDLCDNLVVIPERIRRLMEARKNDKKEVC